MKLNWSIRNELTLFLKGMTLNPPKDFQTVKEVINSILTKNEDDIQKSIQTLEHNIQQDDSASYWLLGCCYNNGLGVRQDKRKAFDLFKISADRGDPTAKCSLGECYQYGIGVEINLKMAVEFYLTAEEKGIAQAQYNLGVCYQKKIGVPQDDKKAFQFFLRSATQEHAGAPLELGICYEEGIGTNKDPKAAVRCYQVAAEHENDQAQLRLGLCYEEGIGVDKDEKSAFERFRTAAEQGNANAQYKLGRCFERGRGTERDFIKAAEFYKLSADQGCDDAYRELASCYQFGIGVEKDQKRADEVLRQMVAKKPVTEQIKKLKHSITVKDKERVKRWLEPLDLKRVVAPQELLSRAVYSQTSKAIMQVLVDKFKQNGVSLDILDDHGRTALDDAFLFGYADGVEVLIKGGANYRNRSADHRYYLDFYLERCPDKLQQIKQLTSEQEAKSTLCFDFNRANSRSSEREQRKRVEPDDGSGICRIS